MTGIDAGRQLLVFLFVVTRPVLTVNLPDDPWNGSGVSAFAWRRRPFAGATTPANRDESNHATWIQVRAVQRGQCSLVNQ
jgi:hypothetical protein